MKLIQPERQGTVAVFVCFMMLPMMALLALSIDYGFLLFVKTDLQRTLDQAVVAAVQDLVPEDDGFQDLAKVRSIVRSYVQKNLGDGFTIADSDIEIGRYDRETIYSSLDILNDGIYDTVRVTIRREDLTNNSVALYFARLFDKDQSDVAVTAAAVLQRARFLPPGTSVLPITIQQTAWDALAPGDEAHVYGDGRLLDRAGNAIPGNWGTLDIGPTSNSSDALANQITNGLDQSDLDSLHQQGTIPDASKIDSKQNPLELNGDTGFSGGIKNAIIPAHGTVKLMPIYENISGQGGNLEFDVVGWGVVKLVDSAWNGNKNSKVIVSKTYHYDGVLIPNHDLSDTTWNINGAFTSPVLVQ